MSGAFDVSQGGLTNPSFITLQLTEAVAASVPHINQRQLPPPSAVTVTDAVHRMSIHTCSSVTYAMCRCAAGQALAPLQQAGAHLKGTPWTRVPAVPPQRHSTATNALNVDVGQLLHQEMIAGGTHKLVKCTAANSMATPPGRGGVHGGAAVQY